MITLSTKWPQSDETKASEEIVSDSEMIKDMVELWVFAWVFFRGHGVRVIDRSVYCSIRTVTHPGKHGKWNIIYQPSVCLEDGRWWSQRIQCNRGLYRMRSHLHCGRWRPKMIQYVLWYMPRVMFDLFGCGYILVIRGFTWTIYSFSLRLLHLLSCDRPTASLIKLIDIDMTKTDQNRPQQNTAKRRSCANSSDKLYYWVYHT